MPLTIVTGAPASGKSTWVQTHAEPGSIRFDSDALTNHLTGTNTGKHDHTNTTKKISNAAREAGIREALKQCSTRDVYIIHSSISPKTLAKYRPYNPRIVIIDPGEETTRERCKQQRPFYRLKQVNDWYANREQWPQDAEIITTFTPATTTPEETPPTPNTTKATLHVVTGAPAAGKTTYIKQHANQGDVVIDYDHIANTITQGAHPDNHQHPHHIQAITKAARQAAIDQALKQQGTTIWIIDSNPSQKALEKYQSLNAHIHVIDPGKDVVMHRCKQERPPELMKVAAMWYEKQKQPTTKKPKTPQTTHQRGYGYRHQETRRKLIIRMTDGEPCWWCGLPMHKEPQQNWDQRPLAADHGNEHGAQNKEDANRLLHFTCNSQRQNGKNDHKRPALTGRHPSEPLPGDETTPTGGFQWL